MKLGVLGFSYYGFSNFSDSIDHIGYYTSNLGDNAQTIAARHAWRSLGVRDSDVIKIDRDTLPTYNGPSAALLMNGVFREYNLPAPPQVYPIFLGFNADEATICRHADWLRSFEPIGCRDKYTAELCKNYQIEAFVTGCVTLTLPRRTNKPANGRLFIVHSWHGLLPSTVLKHIPNDLLDNAEFIFHRHVEGNVPLTLQQQNLNEAYEEHLLQRYRDEALIVLTPLLHVSSPCIAMHVPVIICRNVKDTRFDWLEEYTHLFLPGEFDSIDWRIDPLDLQHIATRYLDQLRVRMTEMPRHYERS